MNVNEKPRRGAPPHHFVDTEWLALRTEEVLEPNIPIVDAHRHLWDRRPVNLVCGHGGARVSLAGIARASGLIQS